MNRAPFRTIRYGSLFRGIVVFAVLACWAPFVHAQADQQQPGFWVTSSAEVHAKPDQAIVYMAVHCSASATVDALADCDQKMQVIQQALDGINLKSKYRFSDDYFGSIRVSYPQTPYSPNQPPLMEVSRYIFVTFEAADMADSHFAQKLASVIDVLTKSGAVQPETQILPPNLPNAGPVIYTLKNPETAFSEATREAAEQAKSLAEETAKDMGVTTKGIIDVRITGPASVRAVNLPNNAPNPLNELHLQYSSYLKNDVTVQATVTAEYSIQH